MDKLKQLESFVSVATRGSLTAAANAEGVAPAIMGRRLDGLEERLGVKLLIRTTRRITLTHEGSAFLEDCQRILADVANAEASVGCRWCQGCGAFAHYRPCRLWAQACRAPGAQVSRIAPRCHDLAEPER